MISDINIGTFRLYLAIMLPSFDNTSTLLTYSFR
nr:MAG TPA: hypothetical protein [Caudoviricetes sp.]